MDSLEDMRNFGDQLRQIREAQELSLDHVSAATHIRRGVIEQIERGDLDSIAAPVYARGFIRTYCNILEADDIWKKYSTRLSLLAPDIREIDDHVSAVDMAVERSVKGTGSLTLVYLVLLLAAIGAGVFLWLQVNAPNGEDSGFFLKTKVPSSVTQNENGRTESPISDDHLMKYIQPTQTDISDDAARLSVYLSVDIQQEDDLRQSSVSDEKAALIADTAPAPLPISADGKLSIKIHGPVRLVVQQGQKVTTRRNLDAGSVRNYTVRQETPVSMSVGNAASVTWLGKTYSPAGNRSEPLALVFYPDGRVRLVEGHSDHFKSE